MPYVRPTKPSNIGGVLNNGFSLFRASIGSVYVPVFLLVLTIELIDPFRAPSLGAEEIFNAGPEFWLRLIPVFIVFFYAYAFITATVHYIASGAPSGVRSPLAIATLRYPTILAVNLLSGLAVMIGTMLLILPGIFLLVALILGPILPITQGRGPIDSLRGSFALVKGYWWFAFTIIAITMVLALLMGMPEGVIALYLADSFENQIAAATASILTSAALQAIIQPLCFCFVYGMYQDLQLRHDNAGAPA